MCLDDLDEMVKQLVSMELHRVRPEMPCQLCKPNDPCWFHKPMFQHTPREIP